MIIMSGEILAFTTRKDFSELLDFRVKESCSKKPIIKDSVEELILMIDLFPKIDVLIVYEPLNPNSYQELIQAIEKKQSKFEKIFYLGDTPPKEIKLSHYDLKSIKFMLDEISTYVAQKFEVKTVQQWTALPMSTLEYFEILPFDVFIKISQNKFIKRFNSMEEIDKTALAQLKERGVVDLYIEKENNRQFSMMLINNMLNTVDGNFNDIDEKMVAKNMVFSTLNELIPRVGLSPKIVEVCESVIEQMMIDVVTERDHFASYLNKLKDKKSFNFNYKLAELTSLIGAQLLKDMNFPKLEVETRKLIFASFFCDFSLKDPAQIHYRQFADLKNLSKEEQEEILQHAKKSAELVAKYQNAPEGADIIILEHHGSFDGVGFPFKKYPAMHPLSRVLLVSQEFSYAILTKTDSPIIALLKEIVLKNKESVLSEVLKILESSLDQNLKKSA